VNGFSILECRQTFLAQYRPDMNSSTTFSLLTLDGGTNNQTRSQAGGEAVCPIKANLEDIHMLTLLAAQNLDIQYTLGLATGVPTTFISVGGGVEIDDFLGALLDTAYYLLNQTSPPQVVSNSYGCNEDLVSQKLAKYVLLRRNTSGSAHFDSCSVTCAMPMRSWVLEVYPSCSRQGMAGSPDCITRTSRSVQVRESVLPLSPHSLQAAHMSLLSVVPSISRRQR